MKSITKHKYKDLPLEVKASIWFLICSFMQKGISVITTPIFTRLLTTAEYGRFSVFNSWMDIIAVFVTLRLYYGVYTQGLVKFEDKRDEFSSSLQGLTLVLSVVWFGIYMIGRGTWNGLIGLTTLEMGAMFLMMWSTSVFHFWAAEQRVDLRYRRLVIITIIVSFFKPAVGIVAVQMSTHKVLARVWGLAIVELLGYTWMFFEQTRKGKKLFDKNIWTYALKFNIPLISHYLAQVVLNSSDRIMIKELVGTAKAGIYSLAYSISMLMLLVNTALQQTINPWLYKKIKHKKMQDIHKPIYLCMVMVAAANLVLILIAPEAIRIFAPASYHEAVNIIPPVAMSAYFIFLYNVFSAVEFYYEKSKFIAASTVLAAGLNVVLNYVFIKLFGYMAAGYTTLACYILYAFMHYLCMNKILRDDGCKPLYNKRVMLIITVLFMVTGFALMTLYSVPVIRYVLVAVILAVAVWQRKRLMGLFKDIAAQRKNPA